MNVLLAIDNSRSSQEATRVVAKQFRAKGMQVRVLHVVEPISAYISADMIPHFVPHIAKVEQEPRKDAKELVQRAARQVRKVGFRTSEIVLEGDAKTGILDHAADWQADLIVVGSHGWKGLGPVLDGKCIGTCDPSCWLFRRGHPI